MIYVVNENCIRCKYMDCVEVCPSTASMRATTCSSSIPTNASIVASASRNARSTRSSPTRAILKHYLAKKDGKIVTFTIDLAERLYAIARVYVKAPEEQLRQLERFCLKLRPKRRPGLTEKNMAVIRAFKDPQTRARLKALPRRHFDEALAERDARLSRPR